MTAQFHHVADKMAGQSVLNESEPSSKLSKRQISVKTFEKWQGQYNSEFEMLTWLRCDKDRGDRTLVSVLWCDVCRRYESKITGQKNFCKTWLDGSSNHRTSSLLDHAKSSQHKAAMMCFKTGMIYHQIMPVPRISYMYILY